MREMQGQSAVSEGFLAGSKNLVMYACVGAVGTIVHFAVLFATVEFAGPVSASTLGAISGCFVNFFLARQFVFSSTESVRNSLPRFFTVAFLGVVLNAAVIKTFVGLLPLAINQSFASAIVLFTGYSLNKFWTFHDRQG